MTNLEQLLQSHSGKEQKRIIILKLKQAQSAVKRQLDLGCSPQDYKLLLKQYYAYQAALVVIHTVECNK
ncbi:EscE/YscE/SsaE family type III secretion system needle protein co-chaperone [Photobacterium leiognathi]|uniref:EscE/YscE/SsaE family type III secretion system needle protein co-chaperone n=1 Tax=Photobacterium leiognathi TaxID=553611 RepID=UPI0027383707|nr:EscE/YscE/SsaE family type III secretion system needle protein co-chaperone [Photobacterium leiognathi]